MVVVGGSQKSLCDEIVQLRFETVKKNSRFVLCRKKFGNMELSKCKNFNQYPPGNTLYERTKSHFSNRISSSFLYFNEAATVCQNIINKKNNNGHRLKGTEGAIFQDLSAENPTVSQQRGASIINLCNDKGDDIWKCLNSIDDHEHYYHAAHVIATSILPIEKTNIVQSDEQLKKLFCKVSIMSGYTERLPAFINQGVERVFDKWQVESIKKVLDNCNDYYTNGGNTFKGYLKHLQMNLNAYRAKTRVNINKVVLLLAEKSVAGYYKTDNNSFVNTYTRTVGSFLEAISPASKRRREN